MKRIAIYDRYKLDNGEIPELWECDNHDYRIRTNYHRE